MIKSKKGTVFIVETRNRSGEMALISEVLAEANVNVVGTMGYARNKTKAEMVFLVGSPSKARKALTNGGYKFQEEQVIVIDLPNKPGMMAEVSSKVGKTGLNVYWHFGSVNGDSSLMVFHTENNSIVQRALGKIQ